MFANIYYVQTSLII